MTVALPGMSRRRARLSAAADLRAGQLRGPGRVRRPGQQFQRIGRVQVLKSPQRGRKVLAQLVPQPLDLPVPFPDQRLMGTRHHLDRPRARAVACHRAELVGIGAHHVGQHVRVTGIALGAGHAVAFPVPRGLQRVHPVHRVPGRDQRAHPRAAVGLDPDDHLRIIGALAQLLPDQFMQPGHPGHPFRQPLTGQHAGPPRPSAPRHDDPQPSHRLRTSASILPPEMPDPVSSLRENNQRPNETVLTPAGGHHIPAAINSPGHRQGHGLFTGLQGTADNSAHLPAATS